MVALGSEAERQRVLYDWNATKADFPAACAHELFEEQAARNPDAVAIGYGDQTLTYRELNERANQLAHFLRRRGAGPDSLVGVSMYRTPLMVIALLGVWKAGAAYVPLDPSYPVDRLTFMIEDAAVRMLLTQTTVAPLYPNAGDRIICLDDGWPDMARENCNNLESGATPANLAYVIYTSGSSGRPKGALIEHRGLVNYLWWAIGAYGVKAGDSAPVHSSISFDLTVTSLYPVLLAGGRAELLREDNGGQSLLANLRSGAQHGLLKITPAHLQLLTQQFSASQATAIARAFVIGGENLTAESLRFWREAAPETRLINEYGPTETVVGCCVYEVQSEDPQNGSIPIGRPISNTQLYVLDEELQPVPIGTTGELYIGGDGVARGYLNRPELTAERFVPDPFSGMPRARLYKTGDLARYRNDGVLEYLGRTDNQVKVRGYRIELGEIEEALAANPAVSACTVLLREDSPGNKQLVGYVTEQQGASLQPALMQQFLLERLPDYMVPAHFVVLPEFPLTRNGKVDRQALPPPSYETACGASEYLAPRTELEQRLTAIWSDLLRLERIGVNDDIFDLGASSLMVITAVARMQNVFGVALELQAVIENATIQMLAALLEQAGIASGATPEPAKIVALPAEPSNTAVTATSALSAMSRILPIRFGTAKRELVGIYHAPASAVDRRESCVLCNPFGVEAVQSHRLLRTIAERLARSGLHVLRFDYFGTGDSAGDGTEGEIEGWTQDVLTAHEELGRRSGSSRGIVFGLGLGATLAFLAAKQLRRSADRLVLWELVTDGASYLATLTEAHIANRSMALGDHWDWNPSSYAHIVTEAQNEALGYPLSPALKAQLRRVSLDSFRELAAEHVTIISASPASESGQLVQQLQVAGLRVDFKTLQTQINWRSNDILDDSLIAPTDMRILIAALSGEA